MKLMMIKAIRKKMLKRRIFHIFVILGCQIPIRYFHILSLNLLFCDISKSKSADGRYLKRPINYLLMNLRPFPSYALALRSGMRRSLSLLRRIRKWNIFLPKKNTWKYFGTRTQSVFTSWINLKSFLPTWGEFYFSKIDALQILNNIHLDNNFKILKCTCEGKILSVRHMSSCVERAHCIGGPTEPESILPRLLVRMARRQFVG